MATKRAEIIEYMDELLDISGVGDHSHNGLQVEGVSEITRVAVATDAAMATYERAVEEGCQMLVAHHGLIWGGLNSITGRDYQHIKFLIENGLNLYAAHLPLDMHPEIGNNAILADMVELQDMETFGSYHGIELGFAGKLPVPMTLDDLAEKWRQKIGGDPFFLRFGPKKVERIGIVSGGGSSAMGEAISKGLDCFVTGEGSQPDYHQAREGRLNMIYLGHYASEIVGVKALGKELEKEFGLETVFIDEPTIF